MPQPTILYETVKNKAQVIALDPSGLDESTDNEKTLRVLRLVDILSRNLEIEQIIDVFAREIQSLVPHSGYQYQASDLDLEFTKGDAIGSCAKYRLKIQNRQLGEISFYRECSFSNEELCDLEDMLCAMIYPVKNALMYQVALKSAYRDPLTGLNNRAAMEKLLPREIELANRHAYPMALLVMDLDGFKQINDCYGHDVGDQVIRDVGEVLHSAVRNTDLLYRYGGDEFVEGLAQTDINGALEVSERIRRGVESLSGHYAHVSCKIEMSIGITMIRADDDFSNAFKRADNALYQAKQGGKNRIIII